jgi:hypothetical protein
LIPSRADTRVAADASLNSGSTKFGGYARMSDEDNLTLREIGGARGDIYGVADEVETLK